MYKFIQTLQMFEQAQLRFLNLIANFHEQFFLLSLLFIIKNFSITFH